MQAPREEAPAELRQDFDDFVRVQYRTLINFLYRRTRNPDDAREIAQESFTQLLRYRATASDAWRPLLYRIAVNVSYKRTRHHALRSETPGSANEEQIADVAPTPEEAAEQAQREQGLQDAILGLPPKCREVFLLRQGHGLSHAEIARRCGVSVKAVDKHLYTAMQHLRRRVGFLSDSGL